MEEWGNCLVLADSTAHGWFPKKSQTGCHRYSLQLVVKLGESGQRGEVHFRSFVLVRVPKEQG